MHGLGTAPAALGAELSAGAGGTDLSPFGGSEDVPVPGEGGWGESEGTRICARGVRTREENRRQQSGRGAGKQTGTRRSDRSPGNRAGPALPAPPAQQAHPTLMCRLLLTRTCTHAHATRRHTCAIHAHTYSCAHGTCMHICARCTCTCACTCHTRAQYTHHTCAHTTGMHVPHMCTCAHTMRIQIYTHTHIKTYTHAQTTHMQTYTHKHTHARTNPLPTQPWALCREAVQRRLGPRPGLVGAPGARSCTSSAPLPGGVGRGRGARRERGDEGLLWKRKVQPGRPTLPHHLTTSAPLLSSRPSGPAWGSESSRLGFQREGHGKPGHSCRSKQRSLRSVHFVLYPPHSTPVQPAPIPSAVHDWPSPEPTRAGALCAGV